MRSLFVSWSFGYRALLALAIALLPMALTSPAVLAASGTVIESFGSTSLVQVGNNFYFYPVGGSSGPQFKYRGTPVAVGQYEWSYIGVEQTSSGYQVALRIAGKDQYTVWNTDSNGNFVSNGTGGVIVSGSSSVLKSLEPGFSQDLNGDGMIGSAAAPKTVIESFGSTSLVQVGNNFYLYPVGGSSGPQFKYRGTPVAVGQYEWSYIGAEQTASGYQVALRIAGTDQYTVWNTDSNGNFVSNGTGGVIVSGSSAVLKSLEPGFRQDLNGDGVIGATPTPVSGVCGSANGTKVSSKPSSNLCSTGTVSSVAGTGPWTWSCGGSNGGATATCVASVATSQTPAPTVAFSANPTSIASGKISTMNWSSTDSTACTAAGGWTGTKAPSGTLVVSPANTTTYMLTCTGSGGSSPVASATVSVNSGQSPVSGLCGSANGTTSSSTPSTNLCSVGTASSVVGSGPWTWSCAGTNGGATATCTASAGSGSGSGGGSSTPVAGNCGMQLGTAVSFCETFDTKNPGIPSRTGDLDPNVWGVSRATGNTNFSPGLYNGWAPTQIQACDGTKTVTPPNDIVICNGQLREATNDNPSGVFDAGGVTVLAMYPKQPFDFAGRTGTVSFDISNDTHGTHAAWPEFWLSNLPIPTPFNHFDTWQALPEHGLGIRFAASAAPGNYGSCTNGNNLDKRRWTVDSAVVVRNYVMDDTIGLGGVRTNMTVTALDCVVSPPDNSGITNHVELRISQNQIDVYATDAGVTPSPANLKRIAVVSNANLSLTRGLIWLQDVHYNADKGEAPSQRQHTFVWDNVAFDGPFTYRDFSYDALDANQPNATTKTVDLGKASLPNQTASWNVLNMPANPKAGAARVLFNFYQQNNGSVLNVIVNGKAHQTPWPYPDSRSYMWRTYAVTIPITDLVPGTNVVQLGSDQGMISSNVNIVLVDVPGGVPVLPGANNAYPAASN